MMPYERLRKSVPARCRFYLIASVWRRRGEARRLRIWEQRAAAVGAPSSLPFFAPPALVSHNPPFFTPPTPSCEKGKKKKIGQGNFQHLPPATSPRGFVWYLTTATVAFTNFICAEFMSDSYSVRTGERSKGGWLRVRCVYTGIMWTIHNTSADTTHCYFVYNAAASQPRCHN